MEKRGISRRGEARAPGSSVHSSPEKHDDKANMRVTGQGDERLAQTLAPVGDNGRASVCGVELSAGASDGGSPIGGAADGR